ncbi:hypothetical protein AH4AK4_1234 [Aeromonas hydrophila 4AK4]|nr:hypothetical protein AH4AK4_1234 [Aeromonas hydrophila 4AK4]
MRRTRIGSDIIGAGESRGSSNHSAWFALAISWQSTPEARHD